jgi:hypothetical protein
MNHTQVSWLEWETRSSKNMVWFQEEHCYQALPVLLATYYLYSIAYFLIAFQTWRTGWATFIQSKFCIEISDGRRCCSTQMKKHLWYRLRECCSNWRNEFTLVQEYFGHKLPIEYMNDAVDDCKESDLIHKYEFKVNGCRWNKRRRERCVHRIFFLHCKKLWTLYARQPSSKA